MLAKISKTFKGSFGNLISDPDESSNHIGSMGEYSGSVVSESTGYNGGRRKEKDRRKRFSPMFSSDVEDDAKSDFNMRSVSMVSLSRLRLTSKCNNLYNISIPWSWILSGEELSIFRKRGLTAWRQR
jgi:hypothetical protein